MSKPCWKRLSSGKYIDLTSFTSEDVELEDIEVALNQIKRFTGHYADVAPLSVASHSLLCLHMAEMFEPDEYELHRWVFCHDFAEAYIGDVATPLKHAMGDKWYKFSKPIEDTVEIATMGVRMPPEMHDRVKMYDLAALDIERRVMWHSQYGKDKWPASPMNIGTIKDKTDLFRTVQGFVDVCDIWEGLNSCGIIG